MDGGGWLFSGQKAVIVKKLTVKADFCAVLDRIPSFYIGLDNPDLN